MDIIEMDMKETLITLTADIVSAHVSNNNVAAEELGGLIGSVFNALSSLGQEVPAPAAEPLRPAVPIRSSVKPDRIICLDCGAELKMLKRHLMTHHGLTPEDYRARWNLSADYPLVAPNYAETRRELAVKIGLGRKPGAKRGRAKARASA